MSMRVVIHAPWPAEYVAELARALAARDDVARLCLIVRADFAYAEAAGCTIARCYPAARGKRNRLQRLSAHAKALVRTGMRIWRERPHVFHVQALHQPLLDWPLLLIARLRGARSGEGWTFGEKVSKKVPKKCSKNWKTRFSAFFHALLCFFRHFFRRYLRKTEICFFR